MAAIHVRSEQGEPLEYATITPLDANHRTIGRGSVMDAEGEAEVDIFSWETAGAKTLEASHVGYALKSIPIESARYGYTFFLDKKTTTLGGVTVSGGKSGNKWLWLVFLAAIVVVAVITAYLTSK